MNSMAVRWMSAVLLTVACAVGMAADSGARRDARALEVLEAMSQLTDQLKAFRISGSSSSDARLPGGLMVANTEEVTVTVQRPGSLHFSSFDGVDTRQLFVHDGQLSIYSDEANSYAQASVPAPLERAMAVALEDYGIDLPLMDLIRENSYSGLLEPGESAIYLGDKRRVRGVDCHQVAIRTDELDVQLWIQEGDRPLPRKIVLTSKWAGGSPRFVATMEWDTSPNIGAGAFSFKAPQDAARIDFVNAPAE